jgi:hypothetical protein
LPHAPRRVIRALEIVHLRMRYGYKRYGARRD